MVRVVINLHLLFTGWHYNDELQRRGIARILHGKQSVMLRVETQNQVHITRRIHCVLVRGVAHINSDRSLRTKQQEKSQKPSFLRHGAEHSPQWRHKLWHPGKCRTDWCNSPRLSAGTYWGRPSGLHKQREANSQGRPSFQHYRSRWLVGGKIGTSKSKFLRLTMAAKYERRQRFE